MAAAERGLGSLDDRLDLVRERFAQAGTTLEAPHLGSPADGVADPVDAGRRGGPGMTPPIHLALVVEAPQVSQRAVAEIAAALQRQLVRDVAPIWEVYATIDAFASLEHVPPGYWPILVGDNFPGVESVGIHLDRNGQPFALVEASPSWSLTASHEAIEMVVDPWGSRTVPGGSPMAGQGLVEILVEVCDPPGGAQWALHGQRLPRLGLLHPELLRPGRRARRPLQLHRGADGPARRW